MHGWGRQKEGGRIVRKFGGILLILAILSVLFSGCAGVSKDTKIKCPKCGAVFTVEEGMSEITKKGY